MAEVRVSRDGDEREKQRESRCFKREGEVVALASGFYRPGQSYHTS